MSEALKDGAGVVRTGDQYLTADSDDTTTGAITIQNNDGLTVGLSNNTKLLHLQIMHSIQSTYRSRRRSKSKKIAETSAIKVDAQMLEWVFLKRPQLKL